jgi:7-carboxy-7-deazaguanine synthase
MRPGPASPRRIGGSRGGRAIGDSNLVEIYSSIQGEGLHVGATTLFVRFGGCDLRCRWCDTPHTWEPAAECRIEAERGSGQFVTRLNPTSLEDVVAAAKTLEVEAHEFVSLTGGEPLLQPEPVLEIARALRTGKAKILLETHGLAACALETVIDAVDVVSMDWKLASDVRRASDSRHGKVETFHAAHERFLAIARRAPEVMVKLVVTSESRDAEIDEMLDRLIATAPEATLILQPVTPFGQVRETPDAERLIGLCARLSRQMSRVRVIPQTHKIYAAL